MIAKITKEQLYEVFNVKEPNCMQEDFADFIMDLQYKTKDIKISE